MKSIKIRSFASIMGIILLSVMFVVAFSLASHSEVSAMTKYPIIKNGGYTAKLSKHYKFKSASYSYDYTDGGKVQYAYIYKDGKKVAKFKLVKSRVLTCIGKYKGKYYFNLSDGFRAYGVYTYKPGSKKFKRLCKNLNFSNFKKNKSNYYNHAEGIKSGRYVIARAYYPTDAYDGFGKFYVYDLKKNKKTAMGSARDVIVVGKKIYWTTTTPYAWDQADDPSIIVKSASISGKNKKTILRFKSDCMLDSNYGMGSIDAHYVTWSFIVPTEYYGTDSVEVKEKYR